jgi:hypothetical protein
MAGKRSDFDGDGMAEIPVTSPWGIGILRLSGNTLTAPMMAPNGTPFGGWLLNTADNRFELGEQTLRLHVKILTIPTISVDRMIVAMQQAYESVGIRVRRVSTETLSLPALNDVDVGACTRGMVTQEQTQLFVNRNNAWGSDVVVYFVRSTVPSYDGCAAHDERRPRLAECGSSRRCEREKTRRGGCAISHGSGAERGPRAGIQGHLPGQPDQEQAIRGGAGSRSDEERARAAGSCRRGHPQPGGSPSGEGAGPVEE